MKYAEEHMDDHMDGQLSSSKKVNGEMLRHWCLKKQLARFKVPKQWVVVENEFPRNSGGKIDLSQLRREITVGRSSTPNQKYDTALHMENPRTGESIYDKYTQLQAQGLQINKCALSIYPKASKDEYPSGDNDPGENEGEKRRSVATKQESMKNVPVLAGWWCITNFPLPLLSK
jgi:hypothetical protein